MAPLPQHGSVINQCVVVENQTLWPLHEVGDRAKALVVEFLGANKQAIWSVRWLSPPENCYKANFDTTMFKSLGYAGIELVVQNHLGGGGGGEALSQRIALPQTMALAETRATHRTVTLAQEMSVFRVQVERGLSRGHPGFDVSSKVYYSYGHVVEDTWRLGAAL